jgi:hypothetical protein
MRYLGLGTALGMALAAVSTAAIAQDSNWGVFDGEAKGDFKPVQAVVEGSDGMQLILKCDRGGNATTYAVVVASDVLTPASTARYENRPVRMRFDDGLTINDNWRFFDKFASAVDDPSQKVMTRFIKRLSTASKLEIAFERFRQSPVTGTFNVTGARTAIEQVYASCKDKAPQP